MNELDEIQNVRQIYDKAITNLMKAVMPIYLIIPKDKIKGISAKCCQNLYPELLDGESAFFIIDGYKDEAYEFKAVTVANCRDLMSGIIKQYELPRLLMNATIIFKPLRESHES